jgi:hypothetical protein
LRTGPAPSIRKEGTNGKKLRQEWNSGKRKDPCGPRRESEEALLDTLVMLVVKYGRERQKT